jgi:UMF1 family MFS transporter
VAALVGFVLGGTQALSRSLFSHTVPAGREAALFGVYEIAGRGTAWLGTLAFGLTLQLTGSYRNAVVVPVLFFVVGFVLLLRVDVRRAVADAGNPLPARLL